MMNFGRKFEIFVIVVIIAFIGIVYAFKKPAIAPVTQITQNQQSDQTPSNSTSLNPNATGSTQQPQQQVPATIIEYKGQDGKTAFELLNAAHRVEASRSAFGDFVTSIDGIAPDSKHFWALYVNGQFSQVGASAYVTKASDNIKWEIDAIVDTTK